MVVWKDKYCIELKDLFNRMYVKDRLLDKNKGSLSFIGRMKDKLKEKTKEQVLHSGYDKVSLKSGHVKMRFSL